MTHYLPDWIDPQRKWTAEDWNKLVDGFDVEGLARQLEAVGAGYYLISQPFIDQLKALKSNLKSTKQNTE